MSDCLLNLRVLFWHIQITEERKCTISKNKYWITHWIKALVMPIVIYEIRLR